MEPFLKDAAYEVRDFFTGQPKAKDTAQAIPPIPIQVNGYYTLKDEDTITFTADTPYPEAFSITAGWTIQGLTGIKGNAEVKGVRTSPDRWEFDFAVSTSQTISTEKQYVTAATLYPPGQQVIVNTQATGFVTGFYTVQQNTPILFFTKIPPDGFYKDWTVSELPNGLSGTVKRFVSLPGRVITQIKPRLFSNAYLSSATLDVTTPNRDAAVYFTNVPVSGPKMSTTFVPAKINDIKLRDLPIPEKGPIRGGNQAPLRDLNTGIKDVVPPEEQYTEITGKGADAGAILSLHAIGPQEKYVTGEGFDSSRWNPGYPMHTNYMMYQRVVPLAGTVFVGQTITMELKPTELGDLMSNMHLQCTLPPLSGRFKYANQVGRALISQIDFIVNETVIETLNDDWYNIRDQLFLDADEQRTMFSAVNGGATTSTNNPGKIIIPLELFFCRRHSNGKGKHERLRRPYFPICAVLNQKIYIRIKFHPSAWFTNSPTPVELIKPSLIIEEIKLSDPERIYYMTNPIKLIINKVRKESTLKFTNGVANLSLTASFPVQMLAWFIRKNSYESLNENFFDTRYSYGYTTDYIRAAVPLTFTSGVVNYIDTIETAKITLNNVDVLSTFQGGLYFSFKQPMEHGLSVPAKNIYMYSFGLSPKEYNQGGYVNFSKLNSQSTSLQLVFNRRYLAELESDYNLNLYYYGYTVLEFQGGYARLPFL
jgi:hypothetical protein